MIQRTRQNNKAMNTHNSLKVGVAALLALMTASQVEAQKIFDHVLTGESFVVATELNEGESYHYTAKKIIDLKPGFSYTAVGDKEARFDVSSDLSVDYGFALYPSLATNTLNISCDADGTLSVIDVQGRKVMERNVTKGLNEIDISCLNSAMYIYQISGGNSENKTGKFIKSSR